MTQLIPVDHNPFEGEPKKKSGGMDEEMLNTLTRLMQAMTIVMETQNKLVDAINKLTGPKTIRLVRDQSGIATGAIAMNAEPPTQTRQ